MFEEKKRETNTFKLVLDRKNGVKWIQFKYFNVSILNCCTF